MPYFNYDKVLERVHPGWMPFFEENKEELIKILDELNLLRKTQTIYPRRSDLFRALFYHPPEDIKLTILAQDPYINEIDGTPQAMGLCFSVPRKHKKIPPSLKNVFIEIKNSFPDYEIPKHGLLKKWAKREKMLLLNSALTVEKGKSNSHAYLWTKFTDKLIKWSSNNSNSVYLLMGRYANDKGKFINDKNKVFSCNHPSPMSAYVTTNGGFFKSGVFNRIYEYFDNNTIEQINW